MGTEVSKTDQRIVNYGSSLPQQELDKHRAWIGVRAEALLDGYWDRRPPDMVRIEIMRDWMSMLSPYTPDEIGDAARAWLASNPRIKPNPGDIRRLILADRGAWLAAEKARQPQEKWPERRPVEQRRAEAEAVLRRVGFRINGEHE